MNINKQLVKWTMILKFLLNIPKLRISCFREKLKCLLISLKYFFECRLSGFADSTSLETLRVVSSQLYRCQKLIETV